MNLLEIIFGLFILIYILIILGFSLRSFLRDMDGSAGFLFLVILSFICWLLTNSLFQFESLFTFPEDFLISAFYFGNSALLLGCAGFSFMLNRSIFPRSAQIFSKISILVYSITVGLNLADFFSMSPSFFLIIHRNDIWQLNFHPISIGLLFIAFTLTILSLALIILDSTIIPKDVYSEQRSLRYFFLVSLIGVLVVGFLSLLMLNTIEGFSFTLGQIFLVHSIIIPLALGLYLSSIKPFFFLYYGAQSRLLLDMGYIGYYLASFTEEGPSPIAISLAFSERMNLDYETLINFSVSGLSALSVYESLTEKVGIIPVPITEHLDALIYLFIIRNPEVDDERLVEGAPSFYAVLYPSPLLWELSNVSRISSSVLKQIKCRKDLSSLSDAEFLENMTLKILRRQFI